MSFLFVLPKTEEFFAHTGNVTAATFAHPSQQSQPAPSPSQSLLLATGGDDKRVHLWDLDPSSYAPLVSYPAAPSEIECLCFNSAATLLIAGTRSGSITLMPLPASVTAAINGGGGANRAAAAGAGTVTGSLQVLKGHRASVRALDPHPFGNFFVTGALDCKVGLWDASTGECLQTYRGHAAPVSCVKHSPDGRWVLSGDEAGIVKVWDISAGKQIHEFSALAHPGSGTTGVSGGGGGASGGAATGRLSAVTGFEFHPIEFLLAVTCGERVVAYWDVETFTPVAKTPLQSAPVYKTAFVRSGVALLGGAADALKAWAWEPPAMLGALEVGCPALKDMVVDEDEGKVIGVSVFQNAVSVHEYDISAMPLDGNGGGGGGGGVVGGNEDYADTPTGAPAGGTGPGAAAATSASGSSSTYTHALPGYNVSTPGKSVSAGNPASGGHRTYARNQTSSDFPLQFGSGSGNAVDVGALEAETRRLSLGVYGEPIRSANALAGNSAVANHNSSGAGAGNVSGFEPYGTPLEHSRYNQLPSRYTDLSSANVASSSASASGSGAAPASTAAPAAGTVPATAPVARVPVSRRAHPPAPPLSSAGAGVAHSGVVPPPVSFDVPLHSSSNNNNGNGFSTDSSSSSSGSGSGSVSSRVSQSSNLLQGTIVPASLSRPSNTRSEPLGLNVNAFMPHVDNTPPDDADDGSGDGGGGGGGARQPSINAEHVRQSVMNDHNAMVTITSQRLYNLRVLKSFWVTGNVKGALDALNTMKDLPVAGDFLTAVEAALTGGSRSLYGLTIETAADVTPALALLLASRFENYVAIALKYVEFILRAFGEVVRVTVNNCPAPDALTGGGGGDSLALEERAGRCRRLQGALNRLRPALLTVAKKHKTLGARVRDALQGVDALVAAGN